jgi:hypothetical protein
MWERVLFIESLKEKNQGPTSRCSRRRPRARLHGVPRLAARPPLLLFPMNTEGGAWGRFPPSRRLAWAGGFFMRQPARIEPRGSLAGVLLSASA